MEDDIFGSLFGAELFELGKLKCVTDEIAKPVWVIFVSFTNAGFTREEAHELTKFIIKDVVNSIIK